MVEHAVPKGVCLETLVEVLRGWSAVGAAAEPRHTADVEEATGISDAVGRQTRFLEDVGVLESVDQRHRLTADGQALAGALAVDDADRARRHARRVLSDWGPTGTIRGAVRENPTSTDELVRVVAGLTSQDVEATRVRRGITTLLDFYEWAGLLAQDDGTYRLPKTGADRTTESKTETAGDETAAADETLVDTDADADASDPDALPAGVDVLDTLGALVDAERVDRRDADSSALELGVDVDADPAELEALVDALRRGLLAEDGS